MFGLSDDVVATDVNAGAYIEYVNSAGEFFRRPVMVPLVNREFPVWGLAGAALAAYLFFGRGR